MDGKIDYDKPLGVDAAAFACFVLELNESEEQNHTQRFCVSEFVGKCASAWKELSKEKKHRLLKMIEVKPEHASAERNNDNNNNVANGASKETETSNREQNSTPQKQLAPDDPRKLIPELCNHFYHLGWASGTGGGLSIRQDRLIYCAPSGVQKERIKPEDMFVLNEDGQVLVGPANKSLKCSECLSLFMVAFKLRNAGCCIHSHSINANLITALHSKENTILKGATTQLAPSGDRLLNDNYREFRITNQEMIKGIKRGSSDENLQYNSMLVVPIIDNVLYERDLAGAMHEAVSKYPDSNAVLVRNHGLYVWGKTWMQAKSMAECYDYLFKLKLEAARHNFDWMLEQ